MVAPLVCALSLRRELITGHAQQQYHPSLRTGRGEREHTADKAPNGSRAAQSARRSLDAIALCSHSVITAHLKSYKAGRPQGANKMVNQLIGPGGFPAHPAVAEQ
jgi:hypothetical protein